MAAVSATCVRFGTSFKLPVTTSNNQIIGKSSRFVSLGWTRTSTFPSSIRTNKRLQICAAKPETVEKVCNVVRCRLALSAETELTPQTKFTELGADSLDTVEIVMELEEVFNISIEDDGTNSIGTIQDAADMIDKLCA